MAERWIDNETWRPREYHNRAPRPALTECDRPPVWWRWRRELVWIYCFATGLMISATLWRCTC